MKRPKHKHSTTPAFGWTKSDNVESAYDLVEYINYWYAKEDRGIDIRHYLAWAVHERYATILFEKGVILEKKELPPLEMGRFKAHFSANEEGLLEVNYYV